MSGGHRGTEVTGYIVRRLAQALLVLVVASVALFGLIHALPGDPALIFAGIDASPEAVEAVRRSLGLNQPLPVQYLRWLRHALRGDLGHSYTSGFPVTTLIAGRLAATAQLAAAAVMLGTALGVLAGVAGALWDGSPPEKLVSSVTAVSLSLPNFWLGLLLILIFGVGLGWLPTSGRIDPLQDPAGGLRHLTLPAFTLSLHLAAVVSRFLKAAMLDAFREQYIRTARAKGLQERRVVFGHVFPNALLPVVTVVGLQFGSLLGGAVLVEEVFGWPGLGRLVLQAVTGRDYLVLQGILLLLVLTFVLVNLLTDLAYAGLDPRIRYGSDHA